MGSPVAIVLTVSNLIYVDMRKNLITLSQDDHVITSIKSPKSSRKFYHRIETDENSFKPSCGAKIETPVIVRINDLPTSETGMTKLSREYVRCSRCNWEN